MSKWNWEKPESFKPGDKVWFFGMKAVVADELFIQSAEESSWNAWAVPIEIRKNGFVTIAHATHLTRRGKKK